VDFQVKEGASVTGDPSEATIVLGAMRCPVCHQGVYDKDQIKKAVSTGLGLQPICVVSSKDGGTRKYEPFSPEDMKSFDEAKSLFSDLAGRIEDGISPIPDESIGTDFEWAITPPLFGLTKWFQLFNPRQAVALAVFAKYVRRSLCGRDDEYSKAVRALLT